MILVNSRNKDLISVLREHLKIKSDRIDTDIHLSLNLGLPTFSTIFRLDQNTLSLLTGILKQKMEILSSCDKVLWTLPLLCN